MISLSIVFTNIAFQTVSKKKKKHLIRFKFQGKMSCERYVCYCMYTIMDQCKFQNEKLKKDPQLVKRP